MFYEDQRLPEEIEVNSSGGPEFNTNVIEFGVDNVSEFRDKVWPEPRKRFNLSKSFISEMQWEAFLDFFYNMEGRFTGFRFKDFQDFKSSDRETAVAITDQTLGTADGILLAFNLIKSRSIVAKTVSKRILKPVAGTVLVANAGIALVLNTSPSIDTITGIITFKGATEAITGISQAANAVVLVSDTTGFAVDDEVNFFGVVGMTEINGLWGQIQSLVVNTSITVDINSSAFTAYTSGGTITTIPQSGIITSGFEYDVPVRFDTDDVSDIMWQSPFTLSVTSLPLLELFNP